MMLNKILIQLFSFNVTTRSQFNEDLYLVKIKYFVLSFSSQLLPISWVFSTLNLSARPTRKEQLPLTCVGLLAVPLMVPAAYHDGVSVLY